MIDLAPLDWLEILKHLQKLATSELTRGRILEIAPLASPQEAKQSFSEIIEAQNILNSGYRPFMESLDLFHTWHTRIKRKAVLKPLELKDVRHFCMEIIALKEVLSPHKTPWAATLNAQLFNATEPLSAIENLLTPNGDIRMDASETLYRLSKEKESLARQIQTQLDKSVKDYDMESYLQDKYVTTREGRWVLPVKSGKQNVVKGIIHATSQTKQTVFMEPETVVPLNNRIRQIEIEIEEEIEKLLTQISYYLATKSDFFESAFQLMEKSDLRFAQGQLSQLLDAFPCEFTKNAIKLTDLQHPLLVLQKHKVVPNTVNLEGNQKILLLSGPNAGGKTVLLKSIGLAAQMARCGLPICAQEGSALPFFNKIVLSIGDAQSVDAHLSTFAAHIKILNEATTAVGEDKLLLIDEICGSTDPEEGSALARSFIESFSQNKNFGVITSHLSPLKTGWKPESGVVNGSLEYDRTSGRPTYQFILGIPGDSLALQTAQRVGVSQEILKRAIDHLSPSSRIRQEALAEIENLKTDIQNLRTRLESETRSAQASKKKYDELMTAFKKEKDQLLEAEVQKAHKKIEELIAQTKVIDTLKRHTALQEMKNELPQIVKYSSTSASQQQTLNTASDFAKVYPPGSKIFIPSLGRDGIVQSSPNNKDEVTVLSDSIRLTLPWQSLKPAQKQNNPTSQLVRKATGIGMGSLDSERVIDLRGKYVEDALEELERALDLALQSQSPRIKIIHGHGTDALKKAIRTFLSRSVYVSKWKAGSSESALYGGGDGVTWAELKDLD